MARQIETIVYNPIVTQNHAHGYKNVRFVENASLGLRLVGFADEIARAKGSRRIDHKGWYADDDRHEVYRGVVYRVPSRDGARYVFGYADPNNDDCALLCFDLETDKMKAAYAADGFAEIFAGESREYNEAYHAGRRCEDIADEIKSMRKKVLLIGEEMRVGKRSGFGSSLPTICDTLRNEIRSLYRSILKARKERDSLISTFGKCQDFTG